MPALREPRAALLAGIAGLVAAATAQATPELPGTGCLRAEIDGKVVDFPLKHTKVDAEVSGPVAQVRVTQTFRNPCDETIEAVYVFPLPTDAAVNAFEMRLGDRVIAGDIQRREDARRLYENARNSGHVAALLEQERTNVFTQSVANILPGTEIDVTLTYVETLAYDRGTWEMAFPTVVGPRFNPPGTPGDIVPVGYDREMAPEPAPRGPDRNGLENPPYVPPGVLSGHDLEIRVDWDGGIPMDGWSSPTHRVDVKRHGADRAVITLHPLDTRPNKDFVLRAKARGAGADTGVLSYHDGHDGYVSVLLHPKLDLSAADLTPKEMIFVLDCSGSMSGEPIAAAKGLVRRALTNVNPGDTFQIIRFSEAASGLAPAPIDATPANVRRGLAYLEKLQGEGGTMMIEGIKAALDFPADPRRLRIVMFLTDGYIGNEAEILDAVRDHLGSARLFSFGVGSSVNRELLEGLALEGRGEVQYWLGGGSADEAVGRFHDRIRNPYLTDVQLVWHGVDTRDAYPAQVPDVFGGKPMTAHARYAGAANDAWLEVKGRIGGKPWKTRVDLDLPGRAAGNPAVGSLWARARIADLTRQDRSGSDARIAAEIESVGLSHHLVTAYTSFVAVEETMVVDNGRPRRVRVPVEMPQGVSWEGVFGDMRQEGAVSGMAMTYEGKSLAAAPPTSPRPGVQERVRGLGYIAEPSNRADAGSADELVVLASVDRSEIRAGESLTLTVTLQGAASRGTEVPKSLALGDGRLSIRVIDSRWKETRLGKPGLLARLRSGDTELLHAGRSRTYTIRLTPKEAAFLVTPGTYHLIVEGAGLGAGSDAARITVRVVR